MPAYDNEALKKLCADQTFFNSLQCDLRPFGQEVMGRVWVDQEDIRPYRQVRYFFHLYLRSRNEEAVRLAMYHVLSVSQNCPSVERAGALLAKINRVVDRRVRKEMGASLNFKSPLERMSIWRHNRTGQMVYVSGDSFGDVRLMEVGNTMNTFHEREPNFVTSYRLVGVERV